MKPFFRHHLMVSLTKVSSLLGQHQLLFSTSQRCFLIETLACLDGDCGHRSLRGAGRQTTWPHISWTSMWRVAGSRSLLGAWEKFSRMYCRVSVKRSQRK